MRNLILSMLYFLIAALFMTISFQSFILKALIIPILIVLFLANIKLKADRLHLLMLAGLLFSWAGDVLLEVPAEYGDLFVPGLLSFMFAQALYLTVFFITPGPNIIKKKPLLVLPVFVYGAVLTYFLSGGLGAMRIPVLVYATVILTMLCGAINRYKKVNITSYWLVLAGAILFVLSDSGIAFSKFIHPFKNSSLFIMSTYTAAQYLIVTGYLTQVRQGFSKQPSF